jgi:hypothetical protein
MLGALSELACGGDLVECEPQRVTGDGQHWAFRIVDGRECWYPGRPGKPKAAAIVCSTQPRYAEERQLRKRRLLKGPKEFRDIRSNVKTTR